MYPLMWLLPQMTRGHQVPNIQGVQYVNKVSCSRKQQQQQTNWHNWELNLEPFDYQADALAI